MCTKNKISNWIDQQHCMKVIVPPDQTTYPPDDTTASYYSSGEHLWTHPDENNCHLGKSLIHQVTPLHILFLEAYTCKSNAPTSLISTTSTPRRRDDFIGNIWEKMANLHTHNMSHTLGTLHQVYTPISAFDGDFYCGFVSFFYMAL